MKSIELKRVVVTGIGALSPMGLTAPESWEAVKSGKTVASKIRYFDPEAFSTQFACQLPEEFDISSFYSKKELRQMDLYQAYSLIAAEEAYKDSSLNIEELNLKKCGVIWTSGVGGLETIQADLVKYAANRERPRFSPFFITGLIPNLAAGLISMKYGFHGPNFATVSACASSTNAAIESFNYIRYGKADVMIAGGAEACINESGIGSFCSIRAMSTRNDDPKTGSRPFDQNRDGFVMGEGAGALIFEEYEHAKKRGAKIYAEVVGGGLASDAYHITSPHPEGKGAMYAMEAGLEDADLKPEQIDYINCHATSTPAGDMAELGAIADLFKDSLNKLDVSGTKSMTGHMLGAAGSMEALICIKALQEGIIPATMNCENLDEKTPSGLSIVKDKAKKRDINYAMSNTFGFGGHNSIIIFKKY